MKKYEKIIQILTSDVPTLLKGSKFKGIKNSKKWLNEYLEKTNLTSKDIRKIHNIFLIICYGSLPLTLTVLIKIEIFKYIGSFMFGIFLSCFIMMCVSWFIFLDCPLTYLENQAKKREVI